MLAADVQKRSVWQAIAGALVLRGYTAPPVPTTSDSVQGTFWRALQDIVDGQTTWLNTGASYADGFPLLRNNDSDGQANNQYRIALGQPHFTRKRALEILDPSATSYQAVPGDDDITNAPPAVTDGHKARCLDDGLIYQRVAGAWVPTDTPPTVQTYYGRIMSGDYVIDSIPDELKAVINLFTEYVAGFKSIQNEVWRPWSGGEFKYGSGSGASAAAAYADAVANYAVSSSLFNNIYQGVQVWRDVEGGSYGSLVYGLKGRYRHDPSYCVNLGTPHTLRAYMQSVALTDGTSNAFDAQSMELEGENKWTLVYEAAVDAEPMVSDLMGTTTVPSHRPADPDAGINNCSGWIDGDWAVVYRYAFPAL